MIHPNMKSRKPWNLRTWATRAFALVTALAASIAASSEALAQEDVVKHDARLDGYTSNTVVVSNDSTALIWLLFVFLGVVALAALFKDAKRTHLD